MNFSITSSEGIPNQETIYFTRCGTKSLLEALGIFSLSFLIHPLMSPIIKANKYQKKNPRDLSFAFMLGSGILIYAGFVGLIAVFWRADGKINPGSGANVNISSSNFCL